jgi:hypothetical protein
MTTLEPKTGFRPSVLLNLAAPCSAPEPTESQTLTQVVQNAARGVHESALRPVARRDAGVAFQPRTLLAILSYCYARQIYGSADIEGVMMRDAHFRQLCGNEFPGPRVLRRFRRDNRDALHLCLKAGLQWLAEHKARADIAPAAGEAELSEEASRRIILAMFMDSMGLDDE